MKEQTQIVVLAIAFVISVGITAASQQELNRKIQASNEAYLASIGGLDAKIDRVRESHGGDKVLAERVDHIQQGWRHSNELHASFLKQRKAEWKRLDEVRWDLDDLRISVTPENDQDIMPNTPENVVVVSKDYPADRLPHGVKVEDKRPEDRRAGYVYMALPLDDGKERRVYNTVIDYNPKENPDGSESNTKEETASVVRPDRD